MRYLALLTVLFTAACTQAGIMAANVPANLSGMHVERDIAYGLLPDQKLDVYIPKGASAEKRPVIVFYYGGRWQSGSRSYYKFVARAFAERGYITVIPDYRRYPDVKFPSFVDDGARALAWAHDNIEKFGGDADRLYIAGHSAGAHTGALLAADPHYLAAYGKKPSIIRAFAGLAGPYAFTPEAEDMKDIFGPPSAYPKMQVPTFVTGDEPPMLLLYGDTDTAVAMYNLERLQDAVKNKDGCIETKIYPDVGHVGIVAGLSWLNNRKAPVAADITNFFASDFCR